MIYYTASEINLSRHTLKLKLPKYRLKKGSIPQYRKPQCLPSSPCTSLGSSHCGNIYFILKVKQHCSRLWVGKLLIQISWILTKIIQPLPQPRPSSSSLVPLRGGKIPGDQRSHPHASGYFWKRSFSSPFSKKKKNASTESCGRVCSWQFTFERQEALPAVSDLLQGFCH